MRECYMCVCLHIFVSSLYVLIMFTLKNKQLGVICVSVTCVCVCIYLCTFLIPASDPPLGLSKPTVYNL